MFKMVIGSLIVVLAFLSLVTVVLTRLNWGENVAIPILLIGLLASVLALSSILLRLEAPESIRVDFSTPVIVDAKTHLPPPVTSSSSLGKRLGRYVFLASPTESGTNQIFTAPASDRDEAGFYCEMLQYAIFNELVTMSTPSNIEMPDIPAMEKIPLKNFQPQYEKNRFSKGSSETWFISNKDSFIPRGTAVAMYKGSNAGVEERSIILTKQFYFSIDIVIRHRMSTAIGVIPPGVAISENGNHPFCHSAIFSVSMSADFDKISSAGEESAELQQWAHWLFDQIVKRYALKEVELEELELKALAGETTLPLTY